MHILYFTLKSQLSVVFYLFGVNSGLLFSICKAERQLSFFVSWIELYHISFVQH